MRDASIFNVQGFSIHDGPGIRTTIFLKGCPLECFWCQNPESQRSRAEPFFQEDRCTGCGDCVAACGSLAISMRSGRASIDREKCAGAGDCVDACNPGALQLVGSTTTAARIFDEVAKDRLFYDGSGGGVTIGGGEPLYQPAFTIDLLRRCREAGIHTALDTCGYANWRVVSHVVAQADLVLYDFKHMDSDAHRAGTGVPNELILRNARRIHHELGIPMLARVPIIPGFNDTGANLRATASFIANELAPSTPVHLNAYHRLGEFKRERLARPAPDGLPAPPGEASMRAIADLFLSYGLPTFIGG